MNLRKKKNLKTRIIRTKKRSQRMKIKKKTKKKIKKRIKKRIKRINKNQLSQKIKRHKNLKKKNEVFWKKPVSLMTMH